MKWIAFLLLGSALACFQPCAFAQATESSELKKYPDIAYRVRAFQLFRFLLADKERDLGLKQSTETFRRMDRAVTLISLQLTEAGVFIALDKPLQHERLERLSPAARVFYDYYRQAMAHNPVFRDLYKPLPDDKAKLYASYRDYQLQGRSEEEQSAYQTAGNLVDEVAGSRASRFPWAWTIVGVLASLIGAGAFVTYRRRIVRARMAVMKDQPLARVSNPPNRTAENGQVRT